jgi:hypothetical protein
MSDLESFAGFNDRNEGMDAAAFERFKERMAAAAAQLKSIQAGEQKQRKKEDELIKLLLKFIQSGQNRDILLLVSRLLEQNVPASFILSILLINNAFIQQELGLKLLPAGKIENTSAQTLPDQYMGNQAIPLKIKIAIDAWLQEIAKYASEKPQRLLATILESDGQLKRSLIQLAILCLQDFLRENGLQPNYESLKGFIKLMLQGIIKKIQEELKNRKQLE